MTSSYKITQGFEVLYPVESVNVDDITVDIIAVPGLGSNPDIAFDSFVKTAEGKTQFNWLTDNKGLRHEFPTARVLLYKSESRWIKDAAVDQSIGNLARNLLASISSSREGATTRPIVFIGHSMGGLVVAKAITLASNRGDEYPNLLSCVAGCLFFGTPFMGSRATGKAVILADLFEKVNYASLSRVLTFLEPGNEALDELRNDFVRISNKLVPPISTVCFHELKKTEYTKGFLKWVGVGKLTAEIVVTEQSATLDGADPIGLTCDHRQLNRFDDAKDGRWDLVRTKLKRIIVKSRTAVRSRLNATRTSFMDDQTLFKLLASLSVAKVQDKKSATTQLSGKSSWVSNDANFKQWMSLGDQSVNANDVASNFSGLTLHSRVDNHPGHNNQSIWLSGPEGRGKSKAAISIIDLLEEREDENARSGNTDNIVVAYFFAAPTTDLSSAENVLKSVLWQLISKRRSLAQYAKEFVHSDRSKKKGAGGVSEAVFTVPAMWKVLMDMLCDPGVEGAYFVMNSLHELPEDVESTKQLFEAIEYDVLNTQDPNSPAYDTDESHRAPMRWLFTSRRRDNIEALLGKTSGTTQIDLDDPKYGGVLRKDLVQHARGRVAELARKKGYSPALRYFASSLVEKRAEDTIWVDVICRQLELVPANTVEVRKTLTQAPQNLTMLLDRTWTNVLDEKNEDVEWTKELLRALMLAFRDPTVRELQTLAEVTHYGKGSDNKSELVEAINRCGALIKIIDYDDDELEEGEEEEEWDDDEVADCRVTFLHDSARTRLQERAKELLGLGEEDQKMQHGTMALRSFSNVLKAMTPPKEFDDADDDDDDDETPTAGDVKTQEQTTNEVVVEEPEDALPYCLEYWLRHAQQATVDVVDNLNLDDQAFWALTSDVRTRWWTEYTKIDDDYEELSGMTALHVAAFFGFTPLVERLLKSDETAGHQHEIRTRDSWNNQPLHWAADKGHLDVIQLLLDHGADINNGREDHVWTPLMMAAGNGQLKAMTMLLTRQSGPAADINAYASDDGTALTLAIARGQTDAVTHLINHGADPNLTGPGLESPFALAASSGNGELLKIVMDAGGYRNTDSPTYGSTLAAAASSSNLGIVQTVFQVDRSLPSRQSALEQAAETASKDIVDYLLRSGPGLQCDLPFTKAAAKGANDILNMLWQYSHGTISQKCKDDSLYTATDFELQKTVELLLAMRASPDAEGEDGSNALSAAAFDGTIDIVTMLLNAGAQINKSYPLQAAASQGHDEVVMLLLNHGANVNEVNPKHDAGTAIMAACVSGFDDTVELLLKNGANPNLGSGTLSCPIIAATRNAEARIVEMLVDARVDANVFGGPDNSTPLNNAAMTLPVASLKTLVERGRASINQVNKDGDSALKMAAFMDDTECVEYLLGVGADIFHSQGHRGTALHAAAARGSEDCCRLLLAHRASPSVIAGPYHTVIQAAASSGNVATMKLILEADAHLDVNLQGGEYGAPIFAAAMQADTRCLKMLLDRGAKADVLKSDRSTVLQTAAFAGCNRNVKILIEHKVDVNIVSGKHGTALQSAALKCQTSTLQALLEAGAKLEMDDGKRTPQSKKNGKYGNALAAAAARLEIEPLEFLLGKEGWSTGATGAYRQALETAAKYNRHGSFRIIIRSKGGKTIPKQVKSNLRKQIKLRDETEDGDENSDFGDDVVYNEQDPDEEDESEEEDEDEDVEGATASPPVAAMPDNAGPTGQRGFANPSQPPTSNGFGTTGYGPPSGYGSVPQARSYAPAGYASQSGSTQRGFDSQQQNPNAGDRNQSYGQTSRSLENNPESQASQSYSQDAYEAGPTRTSTYSNTPYTTSSTGFPSYQQTTRDISAPQNSNYGNYAGAQEPSYGTSGNVAPSYGAQSATSRGSFDPAQYDSDMRNSYTAASRFYGGSGDPLPPQQQSRGFETASGGAVAGGMGGYAVAEATNYEEEEPEDGDRDLAYWEPEAEAEAEPEAQLEEEASPDDHQGYAQGGYGGGYDGNGYGNY